MSLFTDALRRVGIDIAATQQIDAMRAALDGAHRALAIAAAYPSHAASVAHNAHLSKSQLQQDLFVLAQLGFNRDGFFVDFGATDGITLSNTYLLEMQFGWKGILAEPAICWHDALRRNRGARIETACVWSRSGETLRFNETRYAELSTISSFASDDLHHRKRLTKRAYDVSTISLQDLLEKYEAPPVIDYLSIDTEGSELAILQSLNYDRWTFKVITCEHNYTSRRADIFALLTRNGYRRVLEQWSKCDDWFVHADTL